MKMCCYVTRGVGSTDTFLAEVFHPDELGLRNHHYINVTSTSTLEEAKEWCSMVVIGNLRGVVGVQLDWSERNMFLEGSQRAEGRQRRDFDEWFAIVDTGEQDEEL